ncbi:MAG: monovalent cation/H(+) antiporter subunit G [Clostridia bacterium]|nr:monovalent cation/H(+) antiporter subunit G [Clostridia bacterium]
MLDTIRFIISLLLTLAGLFVLLSGVVGIFKFKYSLSRIHAGALFDTAGIVLMVLGVIVGQGFDLTSLKMLIIIGILWLTSPVSGHLIGRLEITINDELEKDMVVMDERMVRHEKEGD